MTKADMIAALENGTFRFRHSVSGRVYLVNPDQVDLLKQYHQDGDVLLHGHPAKPNPDQRGSKWQWLNPKNLEIDTTI